MHSKNHLNIRGVKVIKDVVKTCFHAIGLDIRRYVPDKPQEVLQLVQTLKLFNVDLVLDVGANIGQYGSGLFNCGYGGKLISFEPLSKAHEKLMRHAARSVGDGKWVVHPRCAVGEACGEIEINVSSNSVSSSLRPMLHAHLSVAPESRYVKKERVPIVTLDSIASSFINAGHRIFLKLDTQGYEAQVLAGAKALLPDVCGIQLELSIIPLYEGQELWLEMIEQLGMLGFKLWSLYPGFADPQTGRNLQIEGVFVRES